MFASLVKPTTGVSYLLCENLLLLLLLPLFPQELLFLLLHQLGPLVHEHLLHEDCLGLAAQEAWPCGPCSGDHAPRARGHGGLHGARGPGKPHWVLLLGEQEEKGREERREVNVVTSHLNESTRGWGMGYSLPPGSPVAHTTFP